MKKIIATLLFTLFIGIFSVSAQKIVTASQVRGIWRETSSSSSGITTEFWVESVGKGKLKVGFFGNNANLDRGFSNVAIGIVEIDGVTATFKPKDYQSAENFPCVITLKFSSAKLIVKENGSCGWGGAITTEGTYKKISSKKPNFKELEKYQ